VSIFQQIKIALNFLENYTKKFLINFLIFGVPSRHLDGATKKVRHAIRHDENYIKIISHKFS
jgi:hypothetical protein